MVRVLQVIEEMGLNSGVSSMLLNYYRNIDHNQVHFDFLVFKEIPAEVSSLCDSVGSRVCNIGPLSGRSVLDGTLYARCEEYLSAHRGEYDIIHCHEPNTSFVILKLAKKYGINVRIVHSHNARGADGLVKKIRNLVLNRWGLIYATDYFACSRKAADYLYGKGAKAVIINNAIDLDSFSYDERVREEYRRDITDKLSVNKDVCIIGHVGRFAPQKNHEYLIRIFKELSVSSDRREYVLVLLGDGELKEEVLSQVEELGLKDRVLFAGVTDRVKEYMSAMDIFLLPSRYEGLPVVCVEAQASGLHCLMSEEITREAGITELAEYIGIEQTDIARWVEVIRAICEHAPNPMQGAYAIDNNRGIWPAKLRAAGYDIRTEAAKLEKLYKELSKER